MPVRECHFNFEFRAQDGVRKQECNDEVSHKVFFSGNYALRECSLRIERVDLEDAGQWTCEVKAKFLAAKTQLNKS